MPKTIVGDADSDWAGCSRTRKSTSGGCVRLGQHLIKSYSVTQQTIALSSGEAEHAAIVKVAAVAMGIRSLLHDFAVEEKQHIAINTDATTGRAIAVRRGLGKVRHIALHQLWVQQRVQTGEISIHKVRTDRNPADLFTKHLPATGLQKFSEALGVKIRLEPGCGGRRGR